MQEGRITTRYEDEMMDNLRSDLADLDTPDLSECCFARILDAGYGGPDVCSKCHGHCEGGGSIE